MIATLMKEKGDLQGKISELNGEIKILHAINIFLNGQCSLCILIYYFFILISYFLILNS